MRKCFIFQAQLWQQTAEEVNWWVWIHLRHEEPAITSRHSVLSKRPCWAGKGKTTYHSSMSQPVSLQRNTLMLVFFWVASCTVYSKCANLFCLGCAMKEASELLSPGNEPLEIPSLPFTLKLSFSNLQTMLYLVRETLHHFCLPCFGMPTFSSVIFYTNGSSSVYAVEVANALD